MELSFKESRSCRIVFGFFQWVLGFLQCVLLLNDDSDHTCQMWARTWTIRMWEKLEKLSSKEMKLLGMKQTLLPFFFIYFTYLPLWFWYMYWQLHRKALPIAIAVGVLALAALYFYVNNTAWMKQASRELHYDFAIIFCFCINNHLRLVDIVMNEAKYWAFYVPKLYWNWPRWDQ